MNHTKTKYLDTQNVRDSYKRNFVLTFKLTLAFYVATLILITYWNLTRINGINWLILSIQALPLLLLLPSLLSQYYRAFSWLCFVILLYFVFAIMSAFASTGGLVDWIFVALTVALFCSSMMCARYAQRVQKNISSNT